MHVATLSTRFLPLLLLLGITACLQPPPPEEPADDKTARPCDCPFEAMPIEATITEVDSTGKSHEGRLKGGLDLLLEEVIGLAVEGQGKETNFDISTREVISTVQQEFPQFLDHRYKTALHGQLFCTYHRMLCENPSVSNEELREWSMKKWEEFEKRILEALDQEDEKGGTAIPPPPTEFIQTPKTSQFILTVEDATTGQSIPEARVYGLATLLGSTNDAGQLAFSIPTQKISGSKLEVRIEKPGYEPYSRYLLKEGDQQTIRLQTK
jgi:hypothetical protein